MKNSVVKNSSRFEVRDAIAHAFIFFLVTVLTCLLALNAYAAMENALEEENYKPGIEATVRVNYVGQGSATVIRDLGMPDKTEYVYKDFENAPDDLDAIWTYGNTEIRIRYDKNYTEGIVITQSIISK